MLFEKTQCITLQATPFKERQSIISVYTKEQGIVSLIIKGISEKNTTFLSLTTPFCFADIIYRKSRSDIYQLHDATILCENLFLRKELSFINTAYILAKAILDSQMPHKKACSLYALLESYLKKIPFISSQEGLISSFLLKLLKHEGLIHLSQKCNLCNEPSAFIFKGECLCSQHVSTHAHNFSKEEFKTLEELSNVKSFSEIDNITCSLDLKEKTLKLFTDLI